MSEAPQDLTVERHRDLRGRGLHPWIRRGLLALVMALPVVALLDVFGQRSTTATARGPAVTLSVHAPSRARSGDQFTARFVVRAARRIDQPVLVLAPGWFEQATANGEAPQATSEDSRDGRVSLAYDPLPAGRRLVVWLSIQLNPTDVGRRTITTELDDGHQPLLRVPRTLTVFP